MPENIIEKLFPNDADIINKLIEINKIDFDYNDVLDTKENISYDILLDFIEKHKQLIISASMNDELLIDDLLYDNNVVDRTKKSSINQQYFENLIQKIKDKQFDQQSLVFYLNIANFYNIYNSFDENQICSILENEIYSIVKCTRQLSENRDKSMPNEKKRTLAEELLSWSNRCGNQILSEIIHLEKLKENLTLLYNSQKTKPNSKYADTLDDLIEICDYAINVRDSDIIPSKEEIHQINQLFSMYENINRQILLEMLEDENNMIVHFVRDNEVDYRLVGNEILDVSNNDNNTFDNIQGDFFIGNYIEYMGKVISEVTGKPLDISDSEIRELIKMYLQKYNDTINLKPLDRLPVKLREKYDMKDYIRETSDRLSCSICSKQAIKSHLGRNIGIIVKPQSPEAIISTSIKYTSEKEFKDFNNDSVPCVEIFSQIDDPTAVNETCLKANDCNVIGIVLLSNDEKYRKRAEKLAKSYNVEIYNLAKDLNNTLN